MPSRSQVLSPLADGPDGDGTFDDLVEDLVAGSRRHMASEDAVAARLRENRVREQRDRPPSAVATAGTAAALYDHVMDMLGGRPADREGSDRED